MSLSPAATTAAALSGDQPEDSQKLDAKEFTAALHMLARQAESQAVRNFVVRQIIPPPVLCPRPDSPVRFMPLIATGAPIADGLGPIWTGDKCWTFLDFASFEGADFAYAVCRSLLHRGPSKKQIRVAESGSIEERLLFLLEADRKARRIGGPGRLVNLPGTRVLYSALRTARKLKLAPLVALLRMLLAARARSLLESHRDLLIQRRLILGVLNLLSRRG